MKFIMIIFLALFVTGCSHQPSEKDIKKALETEVKESNDKVKQMQKMFKAEDKKTETKDVQNDNEGDSFDKAFSKLGSAIESMGNAVGNVANKVTQPAFDLMIYELVDVKKLGECEVQHNETQYKCKIKVTLKNKNGNQTNTTDALFVKSEGGDWVILDEDEKK